jgi:hypothetical protein
MDPLKPKEKYKRRGFTSKPELKELRISKRVATLAGESASSVFHRPRWHIPSARLAVSSQAP